MFPRHTARPYENLRYDFVEAPSPAEFAHGQKIKNGSSRDFTNFNATHVDALSSRLGKMPEFRESRSGHKFKVQPISPDIK